MKRLQLVLLLTAALFFSIYSYAQEVTIQKPKKKKAQSMDIICNAYIQKLQEYRKKVDYDEQCEYFLYDITRNGIPELWIITGTCSADTECNVYMYDNNNITRIYNASAYAEYYAYNNYVLQEYGHQGYNTLNQLTYNGRYIQEKLINESVDGEWLEPYNVQSSRLVNFIPCNDTSAINKIR